MVLYSVSRIMSESPYDSVYKLDKVTSHHLGHDDGDVVWVDVTSSLAVDVYQTW